jgi:hypothetical protein
LPEANADLWSLAKADVVAIDNPHVDKRLVLRRSRKAFLQLLAQALKLTVVLVRDYPRVAQEWRDAAESLTSDAFWRSYLATPTEEERKRAA